MTDNPILSLTLTVEVSRRPSDEERAAIIDQLKVLGSNVECAKIVFAYDEGEDKFFDDMPIAPSPN